MRLWSWLTRRHRPSAPPVTPPEEHIDARRRLADVERGADRLERLIGEHQDLPRRLGGLR